MSRPTICRQISFLPGVTYFKPVGIPARCLKEIILSLVEADSLRLSDVEGMDQKEGAAMMSVSRPTFQRILTSARHKVAEAILKGKAIKIEGGHFEMKPGHFRCINGHEWKLPFEKLILSPPVFCPICLIDNIEQLAPMGSDCPFKSNMDCCRRCSRTAGIAKKLVSSFAK